MTDQNLLDYLKSFKQDLKREDNLSYLDSVIVWYLDRLKGKPESGNSASSKITFGFLYFPVAIAGILLILIESIIRWVFSKAGPKVSHSNYLVSFAGSHRAVLTRIPFQTFPTEQFHHISSRTFREIFSREKGPVDSFIDDVNNPVSWLGICLLQLRVMYHLYPDILRFNKEMAFRVHLADFALLILQILKSVRFKIWVNSFFSQRNPELLFLGNDTCYRSYWIINQEASSISVTIQHGIIENKLMYYSISDIFVCWDHQSLDLLFKNSDTTYLVVGYPKSPLPTKVKQFQNSERIAICLLCTKLFRLHDAEMIFDLVMQFRSLGAQISLKLHPAQDKRILNYFLEREVDIVWQFDPSLFDHFIVVDSTFAIDLNYSNLPVIPITISKTGAFASYYNPIELETVIRTLKTIDSQNLNSFLHGQWRLLKVPEKLDLQSLQTIVENRRIVKRLASVSA